MTDIIITSFGIIAIPLAFFGLISQNLRILFLLNSGAGLSMGMHLLGIGATAGGIIAIGAAATLWIQLLAPITAELKTRFLIAIPSIALAIILAEPGLAPALPVAGFIICRMGEAFYSQIITRLSLATGYTLWLAYAIISQSPWAILYELIAIAATLYGFITYLKQR